MFRSLDFSPGPNPKPRLGLKSEFLNPDSSKRDLPRILLQANVSRGTGLGHLPLRHFLTIEDDGDRPIGITLIGPTFQGPAIKKLHPFASKQGKRQTKKNRDQFHCGIIPKYPGKRQDSLHRLHHDPYAILFDNSHRVTFPRKSTLDNDIDNFPIDFGFAGGMQIRLGLSGHPDPGILPFVGFPSRSLQPKRHSIMFY